MSGDGVIRINREGFLKVAWWCLKSYIMGLDHITITNVTTEVNDAY